MTKDEFIHKLSTESSITPTDAVMLYGLMPVKDVEIAVFVDNVMDLANRGLPIEFIFSIYAIHTFSPLAPKTANRIAKILQGGRL